MPDTMQIEIGAERSKAIRDLADALKTSPEEAAQEVVAKGIHTLQRYAFYAKHAGSVTPEQGLEVLHRAGRDNPPMAGDELPEGFGGVLQASIAPE